MPKKPPSQPPFLTEDSEAAYKHFVPVVEPIAAEELEVWNADPEIVRINVGRAVDAVRPHEDEISEQLPRVHFAKLLELPSLALALGFAADKVFRPASPQEIKARQASLRPARNLTLSYLEIVAALGLIPAERVKKIRSGKGPIDEARDGIAIVSVFREFAGALKNKHPFSQEALDKLAEDGNWLVQQLTPSGAAPGKTEKNPDAMIRDQLWTEIVRRYDLVYMAGVALWGRRGVDDHIPSLLARAAASLPPAKEEPTTTP